MIAYPIGYPIGSRRVYPNRPRIARPVSARYNPLNLAFRIPSYEAIAHRHLARGHASTAAMRTAATGGER